AGFLVLSEVPHAETLWLMSTGTGLAPFLSILCTEAPWQRYRRVVLVHAARFATELVYGELLGAISRERGAERFRRVTIVSREQAPGSLSGRIPAAIGDGRLEAAASAQLRPEISQVMLCGNPEMLREAAAVLGMRGMKKNRRRTPGQITVESFW
ncbi:MAG: ferredoxin--NADP reductase, partial [Burkholderiales bacterium]